MTDNISNNEENLDESETKIKIFSNKDEKLKSLGKLLSNDLSRTILLLLIEKEMTASEIANKSKQSLSLIIHHLNKMMQSDIVTISKTTLNAKNQRMKYYTAKSTIIIIPEQIAEKAKKNKSFLNSLKIMTKFATIGIVSLGLWGYIKYQQKELPTSDNIFDYGLTQSYDDFLNGVVSEPAIIPLLVIIAGLGILFVLEKTAKRNVLQI